jgi:hypothetical protein
MIIETKVEKRELTEEQRERIAENKRRALERRGATPSMQKEKLLDPL